MKIDLMYVEAVAKVRGLWVYRGDDALVIATPDSSWSFYVSQSGFVDYRPNPNQYQGYKAITPEFFALTDLIRDVMNEAKKDAE